MFRCKDCNNNLGLAPNIHATITCRQPKLSHPTDENSIYHFKAVVICNLVGETININMLKDSYRDEMLNSKSQFVVHKQSDYADKNGMIGYDINATQSYNTDNGPVVVRANFIFLDDKAKNFSMDMHSNSVYGKGDASYEKTIINKLILHILPDHSELTVIKEIDVEKPWYAPEVVFFDTVQEGLVKSIRKAALLNAQKISGQEIEGLRK